MGAVFQIMIKADPSGTRSGIRRVEGDLDRVKNKTLEVNRALRQIFGVFALRELGTGLFKLVDGYTTLQNKLRVVAKDQANLNGLTNATFKIAQDTRSSWETTASLYQRMALNSRQLGASQKELLDFTKSLNQAVVISGATTTEANAGILQLSQGMASGALRGDELRAVLEQLPVVADVIAKKMGVTRGELRQLGTEGKISGRAILDAFRDAAPELEKQFAKTIPTISQSFEMLRNSAMKFFGEAGTGSGVLQGLSAAVKFLADNMETIGKVVLAVAQAFLGLFVLQKIIQLFRALALVIAANPLTALVLGLTTLILLLRQFGDQLDAGIDGVTTVGDVLHALWEVIKDVADALVHLVEDGWNKLMSAFDEGLDGTGIEFNLRNVLQFIATFIATAVGMFKFLYHSIVTIFGGLPVVLGEVFVDFARAIAKMFQELLNLIVDGINEVSDFFLGGRNPMDVARNFQRGAAQGLTGDDLNKFALEQTQYRHGPQLKSVDFDFNNPLAGAADAARKKFKDDWENDVTGTILGAQKAVDGFLESAAKIGDARRKESVSGTVLTDPTKFQAPGPTSAQENAWKRKLRLLEQLLKKSNEIREAEMKMAAAEELLADPRIQKVLAEKYGLSASAVLSDYAATLHAARFPLEAWVSEVIDQTAAMKGTAEEYEHTKAVLEVMNTLYDKGLTITEATVDQIERVITVQEERTRQWELEKSLLEQLQSPQKRYHQNLEALYRLMAQGRLSQRDFARGFKMITDEFTASNDKAYEAWLAKMAKVNPVQAGAIDGLNKIQEESMNVAGATSDAITGIFSSMEEFILGAAETGEFAWKKMFESMFKELDKLALKIIENYILTQLLTGVTGGSTDVGNAARNLNPPGLTTPGFANGGSGVIPGSGPPDSRLFIARVTPGEHYSFTPPGQMSRNATPPVSHVDLMSAMTEAITNAIIAASSQNSGGDGRTTVVNNRHNPRDLLPVLRTREGHDEILNVIQQNAGAVRAIVKS